MTLHPDVLLCLDEVDTVSLDVFDTSLHRAVLDPVDLFTLVPERVPALAEALGVPDGELGDRYRYVRRRAERTARRGAPSGEIGFADIVQELARVVGDDELAEHLGQAELSLELELIRPSEPGLELAAEAIARGKRLVYVSDMYLPSSFIGMLLARAGLPSAPVFVSSEHGVSKATAGLYRVLLNWADVPAASVVHIGDDAGADHRGAKLAGLRSFHVPKPSAQYRRRWERYPVPRRLGPDDSLALGLAAPGWARTVAPLRADDAETRLAAIGEAVLGPAVLSFTSWIADCAAGGTSPLLFCSRDGMLPLEFYEKLSDRWGCSAPARYFHASRRSLAVPAMSDGIADRHRDLLCGGRRSRSAWQLFERVGLSRPLAEEAARAVGGILLDQPLPPGRARDAVFEMFRAVEPRVLDHARAELDRFARYWADSGLEAASEVVLIDVGWRATVQRALQDCLALLGERTVVRGLYLALLDHGPLEPGSAKGMLVHDGRSRWRRATLEAGVPVVEMMFQADHGSVISYWDGGPVLGPPSSCRDIVDPIQRGARQYLEAVDRLDRRVRPSALSANPMLRLLTQPRPGEARDIGAFEHSDGLADDANAAAILPADITARALIPTRPGRARLRSSEWRPGLVSLTNNRRPAHYAMSHLLSTIKVVGGAGLSLVSRADS